MPGVSEGKRGKSISPPSMSGPLSLFGFRARTVSASETYTADDIGSVIFTVGAGAAVVHTLPPVPGEGAFFLFINGSAQDMTITAPTDKLRVPSDIVNATSLAFTVNATNLGAAALVISDGSAYWALPIMSQSTINTAIVNYAIT